MFKGPRFGGNRPMNAPCQMSGTSPEARRPTKRNKRVTVEIVILALIAAFLGLRLYSVLGRRAEQGEEPVQPRFEPPQGGIGAPPAVRPADQAISTLRVRDLPPVLPAVEKGLRDILAADRRFDPQGFLDGARAAYRLILEAFWRGDREYICHLCDRAVAQGFTDAIAQREAAGEVLDHRLVRINEALIVEASFHAPLARIGVRISADIAAVTRDAAGTVIAGSLDDAVEVNDIWTFQRDVTSPHPDWMLDETDEG